MDSRRGRRQLPHDATGQREIRLGAVYSGRPPMDRPGSF